MNLPVGPRHGRYGLRATHSGAHGTAAYTLCLALINPECARIVSALARYTRDFELAEDVAQEAVAEALVT